MQIMFRFFKAMEASSLIAYFIILFTIAPFLILCAYSVPLGDDFWYASAFRDYGILGTQSYYYHEWSGRYMATFLISTLNPLSYGNINLGFLHPLTLLIGTALSLKFLIDTLINYFKLDLSKILCYSIFLFFYLNYLPDVGETFYWMAGAYTYQVPIIFLMIYIGLLIKIIKINSATKNFRDVILALICLFIILGSNEVIVVYVCCLNSLIAIYLLFFERKILYRFLPLLLVTIVLSYYMIFAAGNFARADIFEKPSFHFLQAIAHSLSRGLFVLFFWLPTFLVLLLCIPGISKLSISFDFIPEKYSRQNRLFFVFSAILIILVIFIGFFPSIYTTRWIPQRAYTPIFFVFIVVTTFVFVSLSNRIFFLSQINQMLTTSKASTVFLILLIISLSQNSNVMNAYVDLTSEKAATYHKQVMATYNDLENSKGENFIAKELIKRPLILPIRWPERHNKLANGQWQEYFQVKNVELD